MTGPQRLAAAAQQPKAAGGLRPLAQGPETRPGPAPGPGSQPRVSQDSRQRGPTRQQRQPSQERFRPKQPSGCRGHQRAGSRARPAAEAAGGAQPAPARCWPSMGPRRPMLPRERSLRGWRRASPMVHRSPPLSTRQPARWARTWQPSRPPGSRRARALAGSPAQGRRVALGPPQAPGSPARQSRPRSGRHPGSRRVPGRGPRGTRSEQEE